MNAPTPTPAPGAVARWTTRRRTAPGERCKECGEVLVEVACDGCGQLAGEPVGMLATVVDTPAGARLVIAEHTPEGWTPVRSVPATRANVAALSRPGATGPVPAASTRGGLW
jgi:hypothetical protein